MGTVGNGGACCRMVQGTKTTCPRRGCVFGYATILPPASKNVLRMSALHSPSVSEVGIRRVSDAGANDGAGNGHGRDALLGTRDHVHEEVDRPLDVRLVAEPREVAADEHVEVLS